MGPSSNWVFLLVGVFVVSTCVKGDGSKEYGTVAFFTKSDYNGYAYEDNFTPGCHPIHPSFKELRSINTNGKCVKLRTSKNCGGSGFEVEHNDSHHNDINKFISKYYQSYNGPNTFLSWEPCKV